MTKAEFLKALRDDRNFRTQVASLIAKELTGTTEYIVDAFNDGKERAVKIKAERGM